MDALSRKYKLLIAKETNIRMELKRAQEYQKRPSEKVSVWLQDVEAIKVKVHAIENALCKEKGQCFSSCSPHRNYSVLVTQLTREVTQLQETSKFVDGLVVSEEITGNVQGIPQLLAAPTLVGDSIQRILDEIWKSLIDPKVGIIGIYGLGGVGKTAAIMSTNNRLATNKIFSKIIWITFSKDFSLEKVQNDIAMQLNAYLPAYEEKVTPASRLYDIMKKMKKLLIIFDDMWEPILLRDVGVPLPDTSNGFKIVVTTRSRDVCQKMETNKYIEVDVLSESEAWDLFVSKAGGNALSHDIQAVARQMVHKCDYLPILIISMGHAMRDEVKLEVWIKALEELSLSLTTVHGWEEKNLELLRFSYNRLRNNEVRNCFLYSAFFPEDHLFEPEVLIKYWIAEGFIKGNRDIVIQINEGLAILEELKDASMLDTFTKKEREWLKMHDLFRDLAINILRKEPGFMVRAGQRLHQSPYFWEWSTSRKISLTRNQICILDDIDFYCPNVTTLLLQDNPLSFISPTFFNPMPDLQLLDLSHCGMEELPSSLFELPNLNLLFLQHCRNLKNIQSLQYLRGLRILSLRGTLIIELPKGMQELVNLRSLDLSETIKLEKIQAGVISSLTGLEELLLQGSLFFTLESPEVTSCMNELKYLNRLKILTLSTVGFEDSLDTIMCLQEQNLQRFTINVFGSSGDFL